MSTKVRELYFKGNRVDNDTITGFQSLMSDVWFLYGIDLNARIHANKSTGHTYFSTYIHSFIPYYARGIPRKK